jgi:CBS domain containing-hemolysin-like protein
MNSGICCRSWLLRIAGTIPLQLVLQHFGTLPEVSDTFDLDGWRIEVVDLDGRRIDKILAQRKVENEQSSGR